MPTKKKHDTVKFDFRGLTFEVDKTAFASLKIQTALNLGERDPRAANEAMDIVCCGHLVDYIERIPDADGNAPDELGCSAEDWAAFTSAMAEAISAKN